MDTPVPCDAREIHLRPVAAALGGAWLDWWTRLWKSLGKQAELAQSYVSKRVNLSAFTAQSLGGASPSAMDPADAKRFRNAPWATWPFNVLAQSYLAGSAWWRESTREVPGLEPGQADLVDFMVRQALEAASPENFLPTNPELPLKQTLEERGQNLVRGFQNSAPSFPRRRESRKLKVKDKN